MDSNDYHLQEQIRNQFTDEYDITENNQNINLQHDHDPQEGSSRNHQNHFLEWEMS